MTGTTLFTDKLFIFILHYERNFCDMLHETYNLNLDYSSLGISHDDATIATYTTYIHDVYPNDQKVVNRPLIIICPGGGYNHLSAREGEPVALKMLELGLNAVILRYSYSPNEYPCALYELAYLISYARHHAEEWHIDPDKIIVAGFSAGGHLAASIGTMWHEPFLSEALHLSASDIRPNKLLLSYPVITSGEHAHRGSFERLLGSRYDELLSDMSLENRVSDKTPECFIWHTFEDATVPVENSILFAQALRKAGVRFELHIFPFGSHGLALATPETDNITGTKTQPECAVWPELFAAWLAHTQF